MLIISFHTKHNSKVNYKSKRNTSPERRSIDYELYTPKLDKLSILTSLHELEGKTTIIIDHDEFDSQLTLYYTLDHCILVMKHTPVYSIETLEIATQPIKNIHDIFELYDEQLVDWGIITAKDYKVLYKIKQYRINQLYELDNI